MRPTIVLVRAGPLEGCPAPVDPLALDPLSPIEISQIDDTYCAFTPDHVTPSACAGLRREFAFSGMLLGRAVAHAPMA